MQSDATKKIIAERKERQRRIRIAQLEDQLANAYEKIGQLNHRIETETLRMQVIGEELGRLRSAAPAEEAPVAEASP